MDFWPCAQGYIAEYPKEPEEILILQVCRRAAFMYLYRQDIPFLADNIC